MMIQGKGIMTHRMSELKNPQVELLKKISSWANSGFKET